MVPSKSKRQLHQQFELQNKNKNIVVPLNSKDKCATNYNFKIQNTKQPIKEK